MNGPMLFGKYCLLERISVGGMAEVFRAKPLFGAHDPKKYYAIKRLLPHFSEHEDFLAMFLDEAKLAVQLEHSNIARVYELGQFQSAYYLVMEYIGSQDLLAIQQHIRRGRTMMSVAQACFIARAMACALDYVHNKCDAHGRPLNIIHRDISPQNVLVGYDGSVKLIDFGIAKASSKSANTQVGVLKGKLGYLSPEQVTAKQVDYRSDIFALGIVFWELLTNKRLFRAKTEYDTLDLIQRAMVSSPSTMNPKVDARLSDIVLKVLAREPDARYQSGGELVRDLDDFIAASGISYGKDDLAVWMQTAFQKQLHEEVSRLQRFEAIKTAEDVMRVSAQFYEQRGPDEDEKRFDATQIWDVSILPRVDENLEEFVANHTIIQAGGIERYGQGRTKD